MLETSKRILMLERTPMPQFEATEETSQPPTNQSEVEVAAAKAAEAATSERATEQLAAQLEEQPEAIRQRRDLLGVLELMQKGVLVRLKIEMPSFQARLNLEHLGLEAGQEAQSVLQEYFRLGKISLLPKKQHNELLSAEQSARKNLYRRGFDSYWGIFVPVQNYKAWKEANLRYHQRFEEVKQRILAEYPALVEEVINIYRPMAQDAWRQVFFRQVAALREEIPQQSQPQSSEPAGHNEAFLQELEQKLNQLRATKEAFIEEYLGRIRAAMPRPEALASQFTYEVRLERIPLPTELARNLETADRLYQERALRDAEYQAAQETIRLQAELEQDLARSTQQQAQQLADEFFNGIVRQINSLISEVCESVLDSINRNGFLGGRSTVQLHNLLDQLKVYRDYLSDPKLTDQIARLEASLSLSPAAPDNIRKSSSKQPEAAEPQVEALYLGPEFAPTPDASTRRSARGGATSKLRLEVAPLRRVLKEIGQEAREVLFDLEEESLNRPRLARAFEEGDGLELGREDLLSKEALRRGHKADSQLELL